MTTFNTNADDREFPDNYLRTEGLPQPPFEYPTRALLNDAYERSFTLIKALVERKEIDRNDAYDAPQDVRIAYQDGEYDTLYHMLKYLGTHDPYVIKLAVQGMRSGRVNTCPSLTDEQMNAATAVRGVILEFHHSRVMMRPPNEWYYFAYAMKRVDDIVRIIDIMRRGIRETDEIDALLEAQDSVELSLSTGVL